MGLRSSPLAYTILPSSAGGLGLFQSSIQTLNQKLVVNYTVSELVNAILQLDQNSMTALIDYYELLSLRNSMNAVKQGK